MIGFFTYVNVDGLQININLDRVDKFVVDHSLGEVRILTGGSWTTIGQAIGKAFVKAMKGFNQP